MDERIDIARQPAEPWEAERPASDDALGVAIAEAVDGLAERQHDDGHWSFELEADATIPAEYILLNHYLDQIDDAVEAKLAAYLRATQGKHGGWPLYHDGDFNMSASVKAYYALKLAGEDIDAPHMAWARSAIRNHGGAVRCNVFTRIALALFGQLPWRAVPVTRAEVMLAPKWFPFHINKVSYWSRTVMIPLTVLTVLKPVARNPRGIGVEELFVRPPGEEKHYMTNPTGTWVGEAMLVLDRIGRACEHLCPKPLERRAITKAMAWVKERLNGEDGLGGIFPAMANTLMAFDALGYAHDHPDFVTARKAVDKLLVLNDDMGYCQPCLSPVWDTSLAVHALMDADLPVDRPRVEAACSWLIGRQVLDVKGDWTANRGHVRPGGWAFQYWNDHYPDVDDTAVVAMALHRFGNGRYREAIERATEWILGMQSRSGGWGAFDADNEHDFLQNIPFADHGALLDPPTADVSARCLSMLAQLGYERKHPAVARALEYLKGQQEENGSWFGRWGNNYVYGTWSVLSALNAIGEDMKQPIARRAAEWLRSCQRPDGGWGEDCATYWQHRRDEVKESTPSQTAWALLGLMAAGEVDSDCVRRGVEYLLAAPRGNGRWSEEYFNAVGFPRIFYLRYHGYCAYFPLWALARYRNLRRGDEKFTKFGM